LTIETKKINAIIKDKNSNIIFEKRDVEVPENWSTRAGTIAASKYFTYNEASVLAMVDRVVSQIVKWGQEQGYFQDIVEQDRFECKLHDILINQRASFNSPVWFNIGADTGSNQASACQPYNALINTANGLFKIGDIVTQNRRDLVLIGGGKTRRILAVKQNGEKEVLRIKTKAGLTIDVTPNHLIFKGQTWTGKTPPSDNNKLFSRADSLKPGDMLLWSIQPEEFKSKGVVQNWDKKVIEVYESYLAGWLQADGFVGQYNHKTSKSLIVEGMAINQDELYFLETAFTNVFPDIHYKIRECTTINGFKYYRLRAYGEQLRSFVEKFNLLVRGVNMEIPEYLYTHSNTEVILAYLRAWFQADGYSSLSANNRSLRVGLGIISPKITSGIQLLLQRIGIFSRVIRKKELRANRYDLFDLSINVRSEVIKFISCIGFVSKDKIKKLKGQIKEVRSIGRSIGIYRRMTISSIKSLGKQPVYDIQTDTGDYYTNGIRVHNCFILPVEDNMNSILNHTVVEGNIFKGGSGAGINISKLRAKGEKLSNRGEASGPISFMRGWDSFAGSINSGGKVRRSAKLVCMDVDHPDILEFIKCKQHEEDKALILINAGVPAEEAYSTVDFQNTNHSIRVSDDFMKAVLSEGDWPLINRGNKEVAHRMPAKDILRMTAEIAWKTGDPGIQFHDRMNIDNPVPSLDIIRSTNPCSEFSAVDNSSCNLASLNLIKYYNDGEFSWDKFEDDISVIITAMDILVEAADYPTEAVREMTVKTRPLGLGFTNLGALLILMQLPYDSDRARNIAGEITKRMTSAAYRQSVKLSKKLCPFEAFEDNKESCKIIARNLTSRPEQLVNDIEKFGLRNSQLTLLAPTGTISFMMDCDTTGIEPLFALKTTKSLAGGGTLNITPKCIEGAVRKIVGHYPPWQMGEPPELMHIKGMK